MYKVEAQFHPSKRTHSRILTIKQQNQAAKEQKLMTKLPKFSPRKLEQQIQVGTQMLTKTPNRELTRTQECKTPKDTKQQSQHMSKP